MKVESILCLLFVCFFACKEEVKEEIQILSASIDNQSVTSGAQLTEIAPDAQIILSFGKALSPAAFDESIQLTQAGTSVPYTIQYTNASSRAVITPLLDFASNYEFSISQSAIGQSGAVLNKEFSVSFTTREDGKISSLSPCTSGTDCAELITLSDNGSEFQFNIWSNYPLELENAELLDVENAIIVIHGLNRNGQDYFNWVSSSLTATETHSNTLLISLGFKISSEATTGEAYWSGSGWREGRNSSSTDLVSSFRVLDLIIEKITSSTMYPNIADVAVTGHSSGGLFTQLYGVSNKIDLPENDFSMRYLVGNSQFFYYTNEYRYNEDNSSFFIPDNCSGYDFWPYGYNVTPAYVSSSSEETLTTQYTNRSIVWFLGTNNSIDGSLTTDQCAATLMGSTRYQRGLNAQLHMETYHPTNNHSELLVPGVGHNGQAMYQSDAFREYLNTL